MVGGGGAFGFGVKVSVEVPAMVVWWKRCWVVR